jgi:hypothetical protein
MDLIVFSAPLLLDDQSIFLSVQGFSQEPDNLQAFPRSMMMSKVRFRYTTSPPAGLSLDQQCLAGPNAPSTVAFRIMTQEVYPVKALKIRRVETDGV